MSTFKKQEANTTIGIIANCLSPENRQALINELGVPKNGLFEPLKFDFQQHRGHIVPLDFYPMDILNLNGLRKAKAMMNLAVEKLLGEGVRVICFTASTKRLPGAHGSKIPKPFKNKAIYSIGDNATTVSLLITLTNLLSALKPEDEVAVLGYGFLGEQVVKTTLKFKDPSKLTVVSKQSLDLTENIKKVNSFKEITEKVKLLVVCTHKHLKEISKVDLEKMLASEAVIVDVSAPPGISKEVINSLRPRPKRFSAGDFIVPGIKYDFEPALLGFPDKKFFYGCFTEAIILGVFADKLKIMGNGYDFFSINNKAMLMLTDRLKEIEASVPEIDFFQ